MNEEIMRKVGLGQQVDNFKNGKCATCGKEIKMEDFRNEISKKEYRISGMCQECQDEVFGED